MLNQQLKTLPVVGLVLYADVWQLSDSSKKCDSFLLTIPEHSQSVSYSLDLSIFIPKLTNLNKTHGQTAYALPFLNAVISII